MNWISRLIKRRCDATEPPLRDPDALSGPPVTEDGYWMPRQSGPAWVRMTEPPVRDSDQLSGSAW